MRSGGALLRERVSPVVDVRSASAAGAALSPYGKKERSRGPAVGKVLWVCYQRQASPREDRLMQAMWLECATTRCCLFRIRLQPSTCGAKIDCTHQAGPDATLLNEIFTGLCSGEIHPGSHIVERSPTTTFCSMRLRSMILTSL